MTDLIPIRRELLERIIEEHAPGYHDCIDLLGYECEWCELRAALAALKAQQAGQELDELRRACAEILGQDPEAWPSHGNAPLAIASALALAVSTAP